MESRGGRNSSLVFCTNGVLLRVLVSKGSSRGKKEKASKKVQNVLADITHIIVVWILSDKYFPSFWVGFCCLLYDSTMISPNLSTGAFILASCFILSRIDCLSESCFERIRSFTLVHLMFLTQCFDSRMKFMKGIASPISCLQYSGALLVWYLLVIWSAKL